MRSPARTELVPIDAGAGTCPRFTSGTFRHGSIRIQRTGASQTRRRARRAGAGAIQPASRAPRTDPVLRRHRLWYVTGMHHPGRFACAVSLAAVLPALAARDRSADCSTRKQELVGRYVQCRIAEAVGATRRGREPDFATCDRRLAAKLADVERKLGDACPSMGDQGAVQAAARRFTDAITDTAQGRLHCSEDLDRIELGTPPSRPIPSGSQPAGPGVIQVA